MWQMLDRFYEASAYQREVVDYVVQDKVNMYTVRARDIGFQVSMEWEWRGMGNTYTV